MSPKARKKNKCEGIITFIKFFYILLIITKPQGPCDNNIFCRGAMHGRSLSYVRFHFSSPTIHPLLVGFQCPLIDLPRVEDKVVDLEFVKTNEWCQVHVPVQKADKNGNS